MSDSSTINHDQAYPVIDDQRQLPEISIKTFFLSIILAIVLAAANAYLGLKMGQTISASIPAAVFAMGILKFFKGSNILENNIVQTAASAGEALVAGIAFTMPAMIVLHVWSQFHYWQTASVALLGGLLGALYAVPLRQVLLADTQLRFPEGRAIGQVLIATSGDRSVGFRELVWGGLVSAVMQFAQSGLKCIAAQWEYWTRYHELTVGYGLGFSPALLAAGYIIGINVALAVGCGILLGWLLGIPCLSHIYPVTSNVLPLAASQYFWEQYVRYAGVGTMLVGGIWTLIKLIKPLILGLKASLQSLVAVTRHHEMMRRTEHDIPIQHILWALVILILPLGVLLYSIATSTPLDSTSMILILVLAIVYTFVASFLFAAVCGYVAGLVGSTNSPVSGLSLAALMLIALVMRTVLAYLPQTPDLITQLSVIIIFVSAIIAGACAIGTDTIQDLKAGQIVGATPWRQQVMMIVGVIVAALVIPLILQLLLDAYGMAGVFPHPHMDTKQMLAAPQAGLMAVVVQGILKQQLSWNMVLIGAVIAIVFIIIDETLAKAKGGLPVMAVGLGIYLPLTTSTPIFLGGVLAFIVKRAWRNKQFSVAQQETAQHKTILLACGMVAGAALMGVLLAIPFAITQSTSVFAIVGMKFENIARWFGLVALALLLFWLYYKAVLEREETNKLL